jgi:hypothetical protein
MFEGVDENAAIGHLPALRGCERRREHQPLQRGTIGKGLECRPLKIPYLSPSNHILLNSPGQADQDYEIYQEVPFDWQLYTASMKQDKVIG